MNHKPHSSDPQIVKYAKWGTAIIAFCALLWSVGAATIVTGVRWAAKPIFEAEAATRAKADSTMYTEFISRLERMDQKQNQLALAMTYPEGSERRERMLMQVLGIRRYQVDVPEAIQSTTETQ